jgi:phosphoserine phosphatase
MFYVATLISHPRRPAVTHELASKIASFLPSGRIGARLDPGIASDIPFRIESILADEFGAEEEQALLGELANAVRREIGGEPVDVVLQPDEHRRKRLLVADMDSTMIAQECIDELADFAGLKSQVATITEKAMRGEIAFEPALRERVALLKGLSESVIGRVLRERIELAPGGRTLVATMRAHGAYTCLVSGGFTALVDPIALMLGFDESRSNVLELEDGLLNGRVREPILGRAAKLEALIELRRKRRLTKKETLAIGDGANDLAMLAEAGLGVAYHAKPAVAAASAARIDHGDLTALLYAQGYRHDQFAK